MKHITQQAFVIDNTNPTKHERARYISLAKNNGFKVVGYYFQSKLMDSIARNKQRIGKANIPEIGIKGTFKKLELPTYEEGFDELYYVEIQNDTFCIKMWENIS